VFRGVDWKVWYAESSTGWRCYDVTRGRATPRRLFR
jgi:hypothetical protein